jgi:hypothetical protein
MRLFLGLFVLSATMQPALAQTNAPAAPSFVPVTLDQADYTQLQNFLADQPFKIANPLLQWLDHKENMARVLAEKADESRKAATAAPEKP